MFSLFLPTGRRIGLGQKLNKEEMREKTINIYFIVFVPHQSKNIFLLNVWPTLHNKKLPE